MLIERDGHQNHASCVPTTEAAPAFGCRDLTALTERDLQRRVGNTIDKIMAGAIIERTNPRLIGFAINSAAPATIAVLRTVLSTPPPLTLDGIPPTRPRIVTGLPLDTATLHATFGHASRDAFRAACTAYSLAIPMAAPTCVTCDTSNMHKAPTYRSSRSPTQHTVYSSWPGDLIGPVRAQSRAGAVYALHLTEHNTYCEYFSDLRSKSVTLSEIETWHTTMTTTGARPHVLTADLDGDFVGRAVETLYSRLGIAHRLRAPEVYVGNIEASHRLLYESVRSALRGTSEPPSL